MLKMAVYSEANAILGSSLSPSNYCICKATAIANGADASKIEQIVANAASNRLIPVSALQTSVVTYTIRFLDWDGTVLKTEYVVSGSNPTPPSNPTRSGYTFTGWSPSIGVANQNQDYTAVYSQNTQYTIIFAKDRKYDRGIYFYMNNGSIVPVSQRDQINANDVQGVAYLADKNREYSGSFLIDTVESGDIYFGTFEPPVNILELYGVTSTEELKNNENSGNPMPILNWCRSRFDGQGFIPSYSEINPMSEYAEDINIAMNFIGGTPIPICYDTEIVNGQVQATSEYRTNGAWYWTSNCRLTPYWYSFDRINYGIAWVPCVRPKSSIIEPTVIEAGTTGDMYSPVQHKVRVVKRLNIECPQSLPDSTTVYQTVTVNSGETPECTVDMWYHTPSNKIFAGWEPDLHPANRDEIYVALWQSLPEPVNQDISMQSGITIEWREKASYTTYDTNEWLLSGNIPINVSCQICFFNNGTEITNDSTVIATYQGNTDITISDLTWVVQPETTLSNNLHYEVSGKRFQSWATGNCAWNSTDSCVCSGKWNDKVVCTIGITVKCYKASIAAGKQDGDIVPASEWN